MHTDNQFLRFFIDQTDGAGFKAHDLQRFVQGRGQRGFQIKRLADRGRNAVKRCHVISAALHFDV